MEPLEFLLQSLSVISLYWLVGTLSVPFVIDLEKQAREVRFFLKISTGFFLFTAIYAVYHTAGNSVLLLVLLSYAVLALVNREQLKNVSPDHFRLEWKNLLECIVAAALLTAIQLYRNDYFNSSVIYTASSDFGIYTTVSEYLKVTGIEVSSPWYQLFEGSADGLTKPYHYTDLWGFGILLDMDKHNPVFQYVYSWVPIVCTLFFAGLKAIWNTVLKGRIGNVWSFVVVFPCIFVNMYIEKWDWSYALDWNIFMVPKIAAFSIGTVVWTVARLLQIKGLEVFILSVMVISDILLVPIVLSVFSIFYFFSFFFSRQKAELYKIVAVVGVCLAIFCFYTLAGAFKTSSVATAPPGPGGYFFWFVKMLVASQLKYYLFFAPVIVAVVFILRKIIPATWEEKTVLLGMLLLSFGGSLVHSIFNNNVETFQFVRITHVTSIQLVAVISLAVIWRGLSAGTFRWGPIIITGAILIQIIYGVVNTLVLNPYRDNAYAVEFIQKSKELLSRKNPIGASIINPVPYGTFTADPRMCYGCNFLKLVGPRYWANQLSIPMDMDHLEYPERKVAIEISPFYQFMQGLEKEKPSISFEKAQKEFINKYKVDFMIIENGAVEPVWLRSCTVERIVDPVSGVVLAILRRPCTVEAN